MDSPRPLISCPRCESALIQFSAWCEAGDDTLIERDCPECSYSDEVAVTHAAGDVLRQHDEGLTAHLHDLADCLEAAGEVWMSS